MRHELKTWSRFWEALKEGRKTFEVRKNDRAFKEGDTLILNEWDPQAKRYTGRQMAFDVGYLTDLPCMPGFVGMSIERDPFYRTHNAPPHDFDREGYCSKHRTRCNPFWEDKEGA